MTDTPLTWLYAPGDRPHVVAKALTSGADVVVVDLEDAVAPDRKAYARDATAELLSDGHRSAPAAVPVHVRVNALDGPWGAADLAALAPAPGLGGLRLPKVARPSDVLRAALQIGEATGTPTGEVQVPLYALLETALGIERAFAVARCHPALRGVALGEADLRADLGVRGDAGLDWPRSRVVVAARAAGLAPPPQSAHPDTRDLAGLTASCAHGRALGFVGRSAVHPRQLPVIERAYLPTRREIEQAETVVKAAARQAGAQALADGRFVDAAVVRAARRTLGLVRRR
ncbi:MAG TPA: CoA ester lyase [Streptomyces sp.]|nr:CoA ester lyase [Streptomyces sp.]